MSAGLDLLAVVWTQQADGWDRHQIRECRCCMTTRREAMVFVDFNTVFCMNCLSWRVQHEAFGHQQVLRCLECNQLTALDDFLEPSEEAGEEGWEDGFDSY